MIADYSAIHLQIHLAAPLITGIDGDAVGTGFIPVLPPQNISKICGPGGNEMITVKGVRAGINPAPTLGDINILTANLLFFCRLGRG